MIVATVGLLLLLGGCATNGTKESSAKEKVTTTTSTSGTSSTSSTMSTTNKTKTSTTTSTSTAEITSSTATATTATTTEAQSTSESFQTQTSSDSAKQSQPVKTSLWSSSKASKLTAFMSTWGQEMGQQYRSYDDHVQANYYGLQLPQYILDGEWTMVIDQTPVSVEWSENGTGQTGFQLVAVYSDIDHPLPSGGHLYFFGFQQNQPKVLVTQQNQGDPNNYLYFKETGNNELKNGFNQIVNS